MKRKLVMILALSLVASLLLAPAALAKDSNHADSWGSDCVKDDTERGSTWVADADYDKVILKSSQGNDVFFPVRAGEMLSPTSGKDISHIIMCGEGGGVIPG